MPERFDVDRLWPDPASALDLDEVIGTFAPEAVGDPRPTVGLNMVTSIDGRAQRDGTAEGLASRADRRLLRLYRAGYDAVGSGAGTLRRAGLWLRVGDDLAERRRDAGRSPQPTGVLIAGAAPVPTDARWFSGDEPRLLFVGSTNRIADAPAGTELLRSPTPRPDPAWVVKQLWQRGISSLLLEGGPHLNAAFLAAGLIDELYWTIGAHILATEALPMIAPIETVASVAPVAPESAVDTSRPARLVSVLRHGDELFLRYRLGARG